jgi:transposase-like protein
MKIFIRNLLSFWLIGIFILFAFASTELDSSFKPSYDEDDYLTKAEVIFTHGARVKVLDKVTELPLQNARVFIHLAYYQGVKKDETPPCQREFRWDQQFHNITGEDSSIPFTQLEIVSFSNALDKLIITIQAIKEGYEYNEIVLTRNYNSNNTVDVTLPLIPVTELFNAI